MKKSFLILVLLLATFFAKAQIFQWVNLIGGMVYANGNADPTGRVSTMDANGFIYVTAWDGYLKKIDNSGNIIWSKNIGGDGYSVTTDLSCNIYIVGTFNDTVDVDPGPGVFNFTSAGYQDVFIEKLDSSGSFLWAKSIGSDNVDYGTDIAIDDQDNVYFCGSYTGWDNGDSADMDPGPGVYPVYLSGAFVVKLDSSGNFLWAFSEPDTFQSWIPPETLYNSITLDHDGNAYVGAVAGQLSTKKGYIKKISSIGEPIWTHLYPTIYPLGGDVRSVKISDSNYLYAAGMIDYKPSLGGKHFIEKLDTAGSLIWRKIFTGSLWSQEVDLDIDSYGDVYVTGSCMIGQGHDFDPGPDTLMLESYGDPTLFF